MPFRGALQEGFVPERSHSYQLLSSSLSCCILGVFSCFNISRGECIEFYAHKTRKTLHATNSSWRDSPSKALTTFPIRHLDLLWSCWLLNQFKAKWLIQHSHCCLNVFLYIFLLCFSSDIRADMTNYNCVTQLVSNNNWD